MTLRRFRILSTVLGLSLAAVAALPTAAAAPLTDRTLQTTVPAAALTHLDLTALDGHVELRADARADVVTIAVTVAPPRMKNFRRPASADLAKVALDAAPSGGVLRVRLANAAEGTVETAWTITVPARFSARVNVSSGSAAIVGLEGGVEAAVDAGLGGQNGDLLVDVPRGKLKLSMTAGRITAVRRSADFSSAAVTADVGDASLYLLGHEIVAQREPGPGHRVALDGGGPDALSLKVTVGTASLKIG